MKTVTTAPPHAPPSKQMRTPGQVGEAAQKEHSHRFQRALNVLAKVRSGPRLEEVICAACDIIDKHLRW